MLGTMNSIEISAEVVADSITETGVRLTTMALVMPRIILPEFNTHRVFSRNARSTRAVPTKTLIQEVRTNPFIPVYFGTNKPGMQAGEEMSPESQAKALEVYLAAARIAADHAEQLVNLGLHKQHAGRIIEAYTWTHVCVTSTEWANWFYLRDHKDAQPEIRVLAQKMREAMDASTPILLKEEEWHLPYITDTDKTVYPLDTQIKISVARCARVSYKSFDGKISTAEKDIELYDKLIGDPPHYSPTEHQATPDPFFEEEHLSGNLSGWVQFRKLLEL